jgi:hypothetical protein
VGINSLKGNRAGQFVPYATGIFGTFGIKYEHTAFYENEMKPITGLSLLDWEIYHADEVL